MGIASVKHARWWERVMEMGRNENLDEISFRKAEIARQEARPLSLPPRQGPNLMVAFGLPPPVAAAAALSSTIEHSGQCTALRVLMTPGATHEGVQDMFKDTTAGGDAAEYLREGTFAGLLEPAPSCEGGGYAPPGEWVRPKHARDPWRGRTRVLGHAGAHVLAPPSTTPSRSRSHSNLHSHLHALSIPPRAPGSPPLTLTPTPLSTPAAFLTAIPPPPIGYTSHPLLPTVSYRLVSGLPDPPSPRGAPPGDEAPLAEHWRRVVLDVASPPAGGDLASEDNADAVGELQHRGGARGFQMERGHLKLDCRPLTDYAPSPCALLARNSRSYQCTATPRPPPSPSFTRPITHPPSVISCVVGQTPAHHSLDQRRHGRRRVQRRRRPARHGTRRERATGDSRQALAVRDTGGGRVKRAWGGE